MSDASESTYGLVLVTVANAAQGREIAQVLLHEQLAACVSLFPIQSLYMWQNQLHQDSEWQLLIKTDLACFPALEVRVRELHHYEVPEIIAIPIIEGSHLYLNWMGSQIMPRKPAD